MAKKKPAHKHAESLVRFELLINLFPVNQRKTKRTRLEDAAAACPKAAQSQAMIKAMCMTGKTTTKEDLLKLAAKLIINEKLAFSFAQSEFFIAYTASLQKFARSNTGMDFTLPAKDKMNGIIVGILFPQKKNTDIHLKLIFPKYIDVCEESVDMFLDNTIFNFLFINYII